MIEIHGVGPYTRSKIVGKPLPDNIAESLIEELNRKHKNSYYWGVSI